MGKSEHIGRKLSATLASTGTPSYFVHAAESTPPLFNGVQP
jgi:arabinose-5-phosphate isomerase